MSNIPYSFDPIPSYFRKNGYFSDHLSFIYIIWAFSRCSTTSKKVFFLNKEIFLEPFEYISGLDVCSKETGLTYRQIRTRQENMIKSGILQKSTSKSTNKYSVYKWNTEAFNEKGDKQNDIQTTSKRQADDNKPDKRSKTKDMFVMSDEGSSEKIINFEDQKDMLVYRTTKGSGKVGTIKLDDLKNQLQDKGFKMSEIEEAISVYKEKNKVINVDIVSYLSGIIINKQKDKFYESKRNKKSSYQDDPVQRSKEWLKQNAGT